MPGEWKKGFKTSMMHAWSKHKPPHPLVHALLDALQQHLIVLVLSLHRMVQQQLPRSRRLRPRLRQQWQLHRQCVLGCFLEGSIQAATALAHQRGLGQHHLGCGD